MIASTGIVAEMTKAFEIANVEMFAISLPDSRVIAATSAVMRKWNCTREELVGKQLAKTGTGALSARHVTENPRLATSKRLRSPTCLPSEPPAPSGSRHETGLTATKT